MFKQSKLALSGITLLVISIAMILFSKIVFNDLAFKLLLNSSFASVEALNSFTFLFAVLGYFFMFLGAGLFLFIGWTSRFRVDRQQVKHSMRRVKIAFALTACVLVAVSMVSVQTANANSMATTGYYLATPYSPYDWLISKFSTGLTYAINGSCWANMMTWPTPAPWASLAGNSTAVVEAALAAMSAGTVYLKEVTFDYGLTVPANVQVIENLNGLTRVFVDDSESQGSPYTISVDTVNPTYYLCQDSAGRYLVSFTSTNNTALFEQLRDNAIVSSKRTTPLQQMVISVVGKFTVSEAWYSYSNCSYTTWDLTQAEFVTASNSNTTVLVFDGDSFSNPINHVDIIGGYFQGNKENQYELSVPSPVVGVRNSVNGHDFWGNAMLFYEAKYCSVKGTTVNGTLMHGIAMATGSYYNTFDKLKLFNCGRTGVDMTYQSQGGIVIYDDSSYNTISNCETTGNLAKGIYVSSSYHNIITDNQIKVEVGGIGCDSPSYNTFSNNHITTTTGYGFYFWGSGIGNTVEGNYIFGSSIYWGRMISQTDTRIINNYLDGTGTLLLTTCVNTTTHGNSNFADNSSLVEVPYNAKIADISAGNTSTLTLNLATALNENRTIVSIVVLPLRQSGTDVFNLYPNEGTTSTQHGIGRVPSVIILATGTNRLQYSQGTGTDDFDIYCLGYTVYND
jgi:parallel beta-helix repeat protein